MTDNHQELEGRSWVKVLTEGELPDGSAKAVMCGQKAVCLTHYDGQYAAMDNLCTHQGGPLGEGTIENGLLRCPWHGWSFDPLTGKAQGRTGVDVEAFPVEVRTDGVYVALPEEATHVPNVSDVIAETLVNWGVRWVFGMVGSSNLGMADALRRQEKAKTLRFIGIRHEGAASFAASAYGKLTGRPAACLSIAGPGATNMLTGLWDANVDRSPVIALTGQVDAQVLGPGAFQELDLQAAFGKVAQWSQPVLHRSRFAELANLACKSALLNRGVSQLILPDEIQVLPLPEGETAGKPDGRISSREISPPEEAVEGALKLLRDVKRPLMIIGHGARTHMPAILDLAEELNSPVITTFKAKGQISDRHPLGGGVIGRSGTPVASWLMSESDCLLVLGASFSDHTGISPTKPTIQVDFDPMTLGKFHAVDVPVWGEIGRTVKLLKSRLDSGEWVDQRPELAERWRLWREEKKRREAVTGEKGLNSATIFAAMTRHVPDDALIAVDVGNNTYSFGRYFECTGQAVLMSGYLGSIGFGYPAAIGAWAASQEGDPMFANRPVVAVTGDGGFAQYMAELTTAVKYQMKITLVLLNNNELGKISKEQRSGNWPVWQTSLQNPNFAEYARICGAKGIRVTAKDELDEALVESLAHEGPSLVEVMSDPDQI
ncbi:MAG: thiamine pyrophosphate-binding protein [Planctomycetota bacterium]|nr:thiamine pyrophosphate-binding protein [Planctomycetota bacterium]